MNLKLLIKAILVISWQTGIIGGHFCKGDVEVLFSGQSLHICT